VTGTNSFGCSSTATVAVTVNPLPSVTANTSASAICVGGSATLTANGAASYVWMPGSLTGSSVSVSPTATTTYTVTGTNSFGCSSTATVAVTVNPLPALTITSTDTVSCEGSTFTLTASGASTYLWLPFNTTGSTLTDAPYVTTTYTVIGTSAFGCIDSASITITVNPLPVYTVSSSADSICLGDTATLSVNGNNLSYLWQPGNQTTSSITVTPATTTTYTVVLTTPEGCQDSTTYEIYVGPDPVFTLTAKVNNVCANTPVQVVASGNAVSYLWQPGNFTGDTVTLYPTVTTTYTVTGFSAIGCTSTQTITINVNPNPVVSISSPDTVICAGESTVLTASGAATYLWLPTLQTISIITVSPATTTTYTVIGTSGSGCRDTANIQVVVNPTPVVTASASSSAICIGNSTTITASGAPSYVWMPGNLTGSSITVNPTSTTTYTVTGTNQFGCSDTALVTVVVNPLPVLAVTTSDPVICLGDTVTFSVTGAATYSWMPGNLTGSSISVTPQATTTYSVVGVTAAGCIDSATATVTVNPLPDVTVFSHFTTICEGNSITAYASGADNYVWYPINVSGNSATFAPLQNTNYYVLGTDANGCTDTANINIYVNPLPVVNASASTSVSCAGAPVTLTATGNASYYAWTPGNLVGNSVTVTPTTTTQYILMGVDTNSCIGYDTIVVNVNPTPVVAVNSTAATICAGDTATLSASGAATYLWLPGNQTTASISVTPAVTTTYTVIGTNAQGCSDTAVSTVVVNPLPEVTVFSHFTTICEGNSITAYASGADNYVWSPINVTGNSATFAPLQNTNYYVTGTDVNGCSDTANINIIVNPLPAVNASASVASTCAGSSVTLSASGNASYYAWQPGNMTGTSVVVNPTVTTQYILMGVDSNSCINYDTVVVNVTQAPVVQVSSNNSSVCVGGSAVLTATGAVSYVWMPGNLTGSAITVTPSGTTTYTVTGTDANGCTATAFTTVTVNPLASVSATAMPDTICAGSSTMLNATGAATYVWMPGNLSGSSVTVSPVVTTTYTVTGSTASGCTDSAVVTVVVNPLPEVSVTSHFYTICAGQSITANAYGANSFVWSPVNATGSTITFTPQVSVNYYVTGTDSNGCSDTANLPLVVNPLPVVIATASDSAVCAGSTVTLSASGAAYYGWQPGNLAGSSVTVNPTVTTTYIVAGSDTNSCVGYDTITVEVYTPQPVTVAAPSVSICAGNQATLIASNAVAYVWMPGNFTSSSITVSPSVTTTYTVTGYSAEGCISTQTVTVFVNPLPVISLSATDTSVCAGNSTTLTATGAGNYLWLPGNFTGSALTIVPANTTTYIVTGTDANGCSDSASITINVLPAPSVSVNSSAAVICAGDSAVLTANGASAYIWMPGNLSGNSITVTPAATTSYTVTGTDNNGCEASAITTIQVNAVPSVTASASASAVCAGEAVNLLASGASNYVWMPGNINGSSVSVIPAATTTYTVTGSDNNGCAATATVSVTVNPIPVVTITANATTICAGDSATLTAGGALSYNWQPGNLNSSAVTVSPLTTTTYTVTGVSADGCEDTDTLTVIVNPLPAVTASASAQAICAGDTTVLMASGATAYVWIPGNMAGSSLAVSPATTTTYTVTGTDNNGCNASAVVTVNVNALPVVSATASDTAVCAGNPVTLSASGAATYNWMPGNLSGSAVTTTPASAVTYTVTGTSAQGCTATATVSVNVNALPQTTATTNDSAICEAQTATLNAGGADTYVWMPGNLTGASVSVSPGATTTYTVTGTNAAGCSSSAMVTVSVGALPQLVLSASDTMVCEGTTISLDATGADNYLWLPVNLTGASVSDVPYTTTTYTVIGTSLAGCVDSAFITVQVNPLPVMILTSTADTICAGGSATLTASGGSSYLWQPGNFTTASITVNPTVTSTYSVVVSTAAGCSDSSTYEIVVMPNPAFNLSSKARAICSGSSVQLTAAGTAVSYTWMPGNLSGSQVTVSPAVTTTYTVTGYSAYGCTATNTITITVNQSPSVTITSPDPVLCAGESAVLNASSVPAITSYTWLPGMQTSASITVTPAATTTYSAIGVAANGCRDTAQIVVVVNPIPTITATPDDTVVCEGDSALIMVSGAQTYTWQPGNFTGNAVYITPQGYETYTITGTSAAGCSNTTAIMIDVQMCSGDTGDRVVNQWIPVPNPSNGMFNLKGVSNGQELVVKVYNAEGRLVYEENDYPMAGPIVFPLDLTDLRSGMYLINITQGEDQQTVRVVIQQ
ncbi:MAG: T9SS type A sorting domain-containing protein, partial [Bacteroidetes bacterium]|nr:T9SS type A sorting domain-containing protein [Bacteroidota bacterium]